MELETIKNKICMHQLIEKKQDEIVVEGDMIVNDIKPDILNVISSDGIVTVYKKEVLDGKVRIDGSINTYIIYLANDENGSNRTLNTVLDFTYVFDSINCKSGMTFNENIVIDKIECKVINERKISVKAILKLDGALYSDEDIDIVSAIQENEDVQILNSKKQVNSLIGKAETKVYAKDTLRINDEDRLAEIMRVCTRIINKSMKVSYNKILAKSDLEVKIIYLTEDNRICKDKIIIPIMGFVDMENVSDDNKFDIDYNIRNIIIKPNSGDENSVYIEAEIEICLLAYEQKEVTLIEDAYSIYSDLSLSEEKINSVIEKENIDEICNVNKEISVPEIDNNSIYNIEITPKINNYSLKNSKINYEMELNMEVLFNHNNSLETKNIIVPFNFEIASDLINDKDDIKTQLDIKDKDINISNSNININVEIEFSVKLFSSEELNVINNISINELRNCNNYSMVIYFVKSGDTLWEIAKKFRSTVEDIARINNIEDVDKLDIGQQLYIPKYVKKNIA